MRGRYKPVETPDRRRWVILDRAMDGYCTLPDAHDPTTLLPLEWPTRQAAEAWLQRCYRAWQTGAVPAPAGWRPHPPEPLVR